MLSFRLTNFRTLPSSLHSKVLINIKIALLCFLILYTSWNISWSLRPYIVLCTGPMKLLQWFCLGIRKNSMKPCTELFLLLLCNPVLWEARYLIKSIWLFDQEFISKFRNLFTWLLPPVRWLNCWASTYLMISKVKFISSI